MLLSTEKKNVFQWSFSTRIIDFLHGKGFKRSFYDDIYNVYNVCYMEVVMWDSVHAIASHHLYTISTGCDGFGGQMYFEEVF